MKHLKYYKPFLLEAQEAQSATQSQVVEEPNVSDEVIEETPKEDVEIKSEKITQSPKYKKPEFEFKEFYRAFKKNPSLRELLPKDIDRKIFKIKGDGFDGEPKWIGLHLDPPSKQKSEDGSEEIQLIGTQDFLKVAEKEDKRFVPFIKYCENLFNNGVMEELKLDFIIQNMDNFKSHDWHEIKKNPKYLDQLEQAFQKASKAGLDSVSLNQTQLVKRYPEAKMSVEEFGDAQSWAGYFKDSINYFNSVAKEGGELPCTQFIVHDDIYYTIGGRRRMFWHFYNNLNPKVWLIKI
jgi:hypothetical protein